MDVIASTTSGKVAGFEKDGVLQFRGVPYAAPPVGPRRFQPPAPVEPWTEVLECRSYGATAPQAAGGIERMLGAGSIPADEDCLFLNVWTPGLDDAARPVMVWIHGGGFQTGSGSVPWYSGSRLASAGDVVIVTINYRLGALGFLHLGDEVPGSGNAGILDQVAALQWVRDNIAAFGGDPAAVTIFGESAGGMSVGTLLGTPAAGGLFRSAIAQSGAAHNSMPAEAADHVTGVVLDELGLDRGRVGELREVGVDRLLAAQEAAGRRLQGSALVPGSGLLPFQPVVDGVALPRPPLDAIRDGSAAQVALLTGTTREEWNLFHLMARATGSLSEDELVHRCERTFGAGAGEAAIATYRADSPDATPDDLWIAVQTDRVFRIPAIRMAEAQSHQQPSTYTYEFTWASTAFGGALGACHAIEIPFAFDNLHRKGVEMFLGTIDEHARALATATSRAWLAFARTGDPNHDGLPAWPAYESGRRATMELGTTCEVHDDPRAAARVLWDGVI
jgi:para-nitrobenzyl esterase